MEANLMEERIREASLFDLNLYTSPKMSTSSVSMGRAIVNDGCLMWAMKQPVQICFEDIKYDVQVKKETKTILHGISGNIPAGSMVAILGASGAGKTSLLNILSRRIESHTGRVLWNGEALSSSDALQSCAYIQQDDLFFGLLTVREHLNIQARLRLPRSVSAGERQQRVEAIIAALGLTKCSDSKIGSLAAGEGRGISGGEKKRLNIATELLVAPSVIMGDEVTTGLDSHVANTVVTALRQIANLGRTVICTIHQPSAKIFECFDQVMLMAAGRVMYFGDRGGALKWFGRLGHPCPVTTNPAEHYIKVLSAGDAKADKLAELVRWSTAWVEGGEAFLAEMGGAMGAITPQPSCEVGVAITTTPHDSFQDFAAERNHKRISWYTHMWILFRRAWICDLRNPLLCAVKLMHFSVFSAILGFLYFRLSWDLADSAAKVAAIHILLLNLGMSGAMTVVSTVPLDKPIIRQEHRSGAVRVPLYINARFLADFPWQFISCFISFTLVYFLVKYNDNFAAYVSSAAAAILCTMAAISIGYFASCLASSPQVAIPVAQIILFPLIVTNGFVVPLRDMPQFWIWLEYLSLYRFGFAAFCRSVFHNAHVILPNGGTLSGELFLSHRWGLDSSLWFYIWSYAALLIILVGFRAMATVALTLKMNREKKRL